MAAFEKVCFGYGELSVLEDFSLTLPEKGLICLFGRSGCGKTTLLRLAAGLEKPWSGRIAAPDPARIGFLFQEDRLLPWVSVLRNLTLTSGVTKERAAELLGKVGLSDFSEALPRALSGGMRRRAAFARALALDCELLAADEPLKGVDRAMKEQMLALLREKAEKIPVVMVTHDREEAAACGRVFRFSGPPLVLERETSGETFARDEGLATI